MAVRSSLRGFAASLLLGCLGAPVSVLYPPQRHLPAKLRAFIDFLAQITKSG